MQNAEKVLAAQINVAAADTGRKNCLPEREMQLSGATLQGFAGRLPGETGRTRKTGPHSFVKSGYLTGNLRVITGGLQIAASLNKGEVYFPSSNSTMALGFLTRRATVSAMRK